MAGIQSGGQGSIGEQGSLVPAPGSSQIAWHTGPKGRLYFLQFLFPEKPPLSNSPFAPWPLTQQTATVLDLPLIAVTPAAQSVAKSREWRWFAPAAHVALWRGPAWPHGFPADSRQEALDGVARRVVR